jgi:hypothetical protein
MSTPKAKSVEKPAVSAAVADKVCKVKKQFEKGVRADFTKAIPAGGAASSVIAKKAGIDIKKARAYAGWLAANGYLMRIEE